MKHTEDNNQRLILEDNPRLLKTLMMVAAGSGFILILSTMNQYGIQSYYRFTYQIGVICALGGILSFLFFGWKSKVHFDYIDRFFTIEEKKGVFTKRNLRFPLEQLSDIKLDKKTISNKDRYRISVQLNQQEWVPLSSHFGLNAHDYQVSGRKIQGLIQNMEDPNFLSELDTQSPIVNVDIITGPADHP